MKSNLLLSHNVFKGTLGEQLQSKWHQTSTNKFYNTVTKIHCISGKEGSPW